MRWEVYDISTIKSEDNLNFIDEAIISFKEIMSSNEKNMLENIYRANRGELFVLQFLSIHNGEVHPSELSAALHASTARISALLGSLEKKGQIARDIDKNNRRNILVTVTETGRERVKTEIRDIQMSMKHIFTDMGEADTVELIRLLKHFFELAKKHAILEEVDK